MDRDLAGLARTCWISSPRSSAGRLLNTGGPPARNASRHCATPGTVKYLAGRVAVMYLGTIVEEAPAAELFRSPRPPYARALPPAVPILDPTVRRECLVPGGEMPSPIDIPPGGRQRGPWALAQGVCAEPVTLREVAPRHHPACRLAR